MPAPKSSTALDDKFRRPLNAHLLGTMRSFRSTFISVFVFSFFLNLLTLAVPLYLLQIYSKVLPSGNTDTLIFLTGIAIAAILTLGLLEAIRRAVLAKAGARFEHALGEHLLDSSIHRALAKSYPSVNALRELAKLRNFVSGSALLPLFDLPWTPLFILVLYLLHPVLGLIGVIGAVLLLALALFNERATREPQRQASRRSREVLDDARSWISNADVIEAMGLQPELRSRFKRQGAEATLAQHHAGRLNTRLSSLSKLVRLFLQVAMIATAAWYITRGELTAGATIASILLLRRAVSPLEQSIRSWKSVLSAREGLRVISEYLDHAVSLAPGNPPPSPDGILLAKNVSFRRSGEKRSTFSRVNLELPEGTFTVLTGPTGAGKSTLLRVLAGIVSPNNGNVTLGGHDLTVWRAEQRGPYLGYLPQDVSLFPVSVKENIARLTDAHIDEVIDAAKLAHAHELVQSLPAGYDTQVNEDGRNLSGGQRQRIGYARALFGTPMVVLLDEPDSNLDSAGRSALRKSLRKLRRSGTAILAITHHESLEKLADRVYHLENGKVKLVRSNDEIIARRQAEEAAKNRKRAAFESISSSISSVSEPLSGQQSSNDSVQASLGTGTVATAGTGPVVPLKPNVLNAQPSSSAPPARSLSASIDQKTKQDSAPGKSAKNQTIESVEAIEPDNISSEKADETFAAQVDQVDSGAKENMSVSDSDTKLRLRLARKMFLYSSSRNKD